MRVARLLREALGLGELEGRVLLRLDDVLVDLEGRLPRRALDLLAVPLAAAPEAVAHALDAQDAPQPEGREHQRRQLAVDAVELLELDVAVAWVIRRRFDVSVPRARSGKKASTRRARPEG